MALPICPNQDCYEFQTTYHKKECTYRLVNCPVKDCEYVPFYNIQGHLQDDHQISQCNNYSGIYYRTEVLQEYEFENGKIAWDPLQMRWDDRWFIIGREKSRTEDNMYFWVQLVGSEYEAKNYNYTIEFEGHDYATEWFTGQVFSIDESRSG